MCKDGEMQVGAWLRMKGIKAQTGGVEMMEETPQALGRSEGQTTGLNWAKVPSSEARDAKRDGGGGALLGWCGGEPSVQRETG